MPNQKRTKIVATLGPATSEKKIIKNMILEGVNVFRINFSHADYKDVEERIKMIRELNDEFVLSDIAEVYVPIFEARLVGPKKKVGIIRIDAVRKKIL